VQTLVRAFKIYVRPILEYAGFIWSPYHSDDILRMKTVHCRFTKRLPGFKHTSYLAKWNSLNIEAEAISNLPVHFVQFS